jgi:hypothetical protein
VVATDISELSAYIDAKIIVPFYATNFIPVVIWSTIKPFRNVVNYIDYVGLVEGGA